MGNIDEKKLSELLERISDIKVELEALENDVRGLCTVTEPVAPAAKPVGVTATVVRQNSQTSEMPVPAETLSVPTDDTPIEIDIPDMDIPPIIEDPATEYVTVPVDANEPAEATEQETPTKPTALDDLPFDDDLPADTPSAAPKVKAAILDSKKPETAVMDVMAEKQAWRTDRPGSQVKNVISAISLNDRVLLINVLFKEDPILFQNTISAFNDMSTLDEALAYIQTNFPDWDMNSEPVYRLMMAVRRKLG